MYYTCSYFYSFLSALYSYLDVFGPFATKHVHHGNGEIGPRQGSHWSTRTRR